MVRFPDGSTISCSKSRPSAYVTLHSVWNAWGCTHNESVCRLTRDPDLDDGGYSSPQMMISFVGRGVT
jgi:hypothetical protein